MAPAPKPKQLTLPLTPKVTEPKIEECPYLGPIEPEPFLPEATRLEMQAGREALQRHAESREAALGRGEVPEAPPPDDIVKRDPTHVSNFRWTPEQQRARAV
jgi:hypothetical protein